VFRVLAKVVPVTLSLDKTNIEFRFGEESSEMYTTEILKLTNNGNATAHFKWKLPEECNFTIDPIEGSVEGKKQTLSVEITYKPEGKVR